MRSRVRSRPILPCAAAAPDAYSWLVPEVRPPSARQVDRGGGMTAAAPRSASHLFVVNQDESHVLRDDEFCQARSGWTGCACLASRVRHRKVDDERVDAAACLLRPELTLLSRTLLTILCHHPQRDWTNILDFLKLIYVRDFVIDFSVWRSAALMRSRSCARCSPRRAR